MPTAALMQTLKTQRSRSAPASTHTVAPPTAPPRTSRTPARRHVDASGSTVNVEVGDVTVTGADQ